MRSNMFAWPGSPSNSSAFDFSNEPPVHSFNCLKPISKLVMDSVPHSTRNDGRRSPRFDKVYMPMAYSGDPFWRMGCRDGLLNHSYTPFIALLYAIKLQPEWLIAELRGMIVTKDDYIRIRCEFNELYNRLLESRGSGRQGTASEDEFFRLGYLFYILSETCDSSLGLMVTPFGDFNNPWTGKDAHVFPKLGVSVIRHWSDKLQQVTLSDLNWRSFYFRYLNQSNENSFWVFNFPTLDPFSFNHRAEVKDDDFFEFVLSYLKTLTSRGIRTMITVPVSMQRMTGIFTKLDLVPSGPYMRSNDVIVQSVETLDCIEPFRLILTNYTPSSSNAFEILPR